MEMLKNLMETITGMGATAILPLVIFILGLVFRMKPGAAIKSGITVGIGFIGLGLVVGLLNSSLQPAIEYYWICPYISRHLLSLNPLQARCRRYSRGER